MAIQFNAIPVGLEVPGVYAEFDSSQAGAGTQPRRMLLVGQVAPGGTAATGTVLRVEGADRASALFGAGSQMGAMARAAKTAHPIGEVWALPLADASGAAKASASITVTAANAKAGTIALYVAGRARGSGLGRGAGR